MKKFLLLLFCSFAFGQASNQMVTFTQAQSLGFSLNSGQSHVTSSECITKTQALAKYNLSTSAMSAYATNQLVPRSAWVAGSPAITFTPITNYYDDPCTATADMWIDNIVPSHYYSDNAGTLYNGYVYDFMWFNGADYDWYEIHLVNGVIVSTNLMFSPCSPY